MDPLETPMPNRLLGPYKAIESSRELTLEFHVIFEGDKQTTGLRAKAWADKMRALMKEAEEWEDE